MGDIIKVIVTGGGAPGVAGTISALRINPDGVVFEVITTDTRDDVVGKYLSDKFYEVPPPEDDTYIPMLQEIARKERVNVIIPQTTREIGVLSENKEKFINLGIAVIVSSAKSIRVANDKFLLLEKAKQIGTPYPDYYLANSRDSLIWAVESLGYPGKKVIVKPRTSNGMRGLRILTEEPWNVQKFLNEETKRSGNKFEYAFGHITHRALA